MKSAGKYSVFYVVSSAITLVYVTIRAFTVDITFDEVWTLKDFVPQSFFQILNYSAANTNNHILNTLLIKLLLLLFGKGLFIIRLPNVIAFIMYVWFSFRITSRFLTGGPGVVTFLLLLLNPFLLDFFSLARGYGLAIGLETACLYYLLLFYKQSNAVRHLCIAFMFAAFSVIANFTLINFFLAIGLLVVVNVIQVSEKRWAKLLAVSVITVLLTLIIWEPLRKIRDEHLLDYGGSDGFYPDTLVSLAHYTAYSQHSSPVILFCLNFFLLCFVGVLFLSIREKQFWLNKNYPALLILSVSCLSSILQHHFIGNPYLLERAALFLYPLIIFSFGFSLITTRWKPIRLSVSLTLLALFAFNFFTQANFRRTVSWFFCAHYSEILEKIEIQGKNLHQQRVLDFSSPLAYTMRYYTGQTPYPHILLLDDWLSAHKQPFDVYVYLSRTLDRSLYSPGDEIIHRFKKDTLAVYDDVGLYVFYNFRIQ